MRDLISYILEYLVESLADCSLRQINPNTFFEAIYSCDEVLIASFISSGASKKLLKAL